MGDKKETFTERTFRELRAGKTNPSRKKKRNISRIIMLFDALIILAAIIFLNTRNSKNDYATSSVSKDGLNASLSVNAEKKTESYAFTVTLLSSLDEEKTWYFEPNLATLKLTLKGDTFYEDKFGTKISKITLLPGEARTFPLRISFEIVDRYLAEKANVIKRRKNLFDVLVKPTKNIMAEAVLNLEEIEEGVTVLVSFEHEVAL
jgi:hypothetical protein